MFALPCRRLTAMGLLASLCACAIAPVPVPAPVPAVSTTSLATKPDSTTTTSPAPTVQSATPKARADRPLPVVDPEHNVFFALGSTELNAAARAVIAELSKSLLANVGTRALLVGYTDDLGSPEYSIALSGKRASTVAAEFLKLGVRPSQLRKASRGSQPFDRPCKSEACRRLMRRVKIQLATRTP